MDQNKSNCIASIIIPTYNEENYIGILLDNLSNQSSAKEIEIIISDAKSSDKTREVAESYRHFFGDFKIVDGGMPGPGRNIGANASSGEFLFFIDADMVITDNNFISKSLSYIKKNNLGIAPVYLKPLGTNIIDKILVGVYDIILYLSKYVVRPLGAMCIVVKKSAFDMGGGYPEDVVMNEDHDFVLNTSKISKYGVIPLSVSFSVRRFEKEGRFGIIWKYLFATYHNLVNGPIKKPIFTYEFGYEEKKSK